MSHRSSAPRTSLNNLHHALYRFYDHTDVLLYVGISADLPGRMQNHRRKKPWWALVDHIGIEHFDSRKEAMEAEKAAIKTEEPLYNDAHNANMWPEPSPPPHEFTPKWMRENWAKVPISARDEVEMPAWDQGQDDLAETILIDFDDPERERLTKEAFRRAAEYDELPPQGTYLKVCTALASVAEAREHAELLFNATLSLLRARLGDQFDERWKEAVTASGARTAEQVLAYLTKTVAGEYDNGSEAPRGA